jgi:hypothetical protein
VFLAFLSIYRMNLINPFEAEGRHADTHATAVRLKDGLYKMYKSISSAEGNGLRILAGVLELSAVG